MKKVISLFLTAIVAIIGIIFIAPQESQAVPAFARQTGQACQACHFQHYPALTAFGRAFKAGGFTMVGGQSLIEGDLLSVPSVLNASIVLKVRYQKTNGEGTTKTTSAYELDPATGLIGLVETTEDTRDKGTNKGELQFPDEAALFLGGRVGEHVGFALEMGLGGEGADNFTSFKIPFVYKVGGVNLSVIPFTTDALGVSFGFELLNTGAVRNQRILEHRSDISAQQYIGTATAAEGFAFVAAHDMGFINFSLWGPSHYATDVGPLSQYFRAAVTPKVGAWDLGAGVQWWGGKTKVGSDVGDAPAGEYNTKAWAVDAQAQGSVGRMPLGVYLTYADAKKSNDGEPVNVFNSSKHGAKKAWTILAELGVLPNRVTLAAGYRSGDKGTAANNKQNAVILGITYLFIQNVELQLNYSRYSGSYYDLKKNNEEANGDQLITAMLFTAF